MPAVRSSPLVTMPVVRSLPLVALPACNTGMGFA